jgi:hypothetical protein
MLDKERKFFAEKRSELQTRYPDKFVVVKDEEVIGAFNTIEEALSEGARRFGLQSFLVRHVTDSEETINIPALTLGILRADSPHSI